MRHRLRDIPRTRRDGGAGKKQKPRKNVPAMLNMDRHQDDQCDHDKGEGQDAMNLDDAVSDDKRPELVLLDLDLPLSADIGVYRAARDLTVHVPQ
jgi:hypothetical protein